MSGINDIKNAFAKAAPGIDLRAVRMRYEGNETVLEFDICRADGAKQTVEERLPNTAGMTPLLDAAMKVAKALIAKVEVQDNTPSMANPLAEKAAEGITKLVGDLPPERQAKIEGRTQELVEEIKNGTYELVEDGAPPPKPALFF